MSYNENESKTSRGPSCWRCRKKKRAKCDAGNKFPRCTNCAQANIDCTFVRKYRPTKPYLENLEKMAADAEMRLRQLIPHGDLDYWIANVEELEEEEEAHFIPTYRKDSDKSFHGKSSGQSLVHFVLNMKQINTGVGKDQETFVNDRLRPEFWNPRPWETLRVHQRPVYEFPSDDLMASLIDLYFAHVHIFFPLLHRPTFERKIAEGEHLDVTSKFGTTVMLAMAISSRFSDDPRVLAQGYDSPLSSGWKWFGQVEPVLYGIVDCYTQTTSLYDLQTTCLSAMFAMGTLPLNAIWSQLGIAIRAAQDIGAHRKKPKCKQGDPVTEEMLKRAWWVLVCMDTFSSSIMGRPCMISREDFDVDLPTNCDDEYWEQNFQQPVDKPSKVSAFICYIQIMEMMAIALRKLYCIKTGRNDLNPTITEWENVASLDSAFTRWFDAVPQHIRWDPQNPDPVFFAQSVQIYCSFYHLQILVHRPFLQKSEKISPQFKASLAICTNAARSCINAVDTYHRHTGLTISFVLPKIFTAGVVLLLEMWVAKSGGPSVNLPEGMVDILNCLDLLERAEKRWVFAGHFRDVLTELAQFEEEVPQHAVSRNKGPPPGSWCITMDAETDQLLRILSDSWYERGDSYCPSSDTPAPFPGEWMDPVQPRNLHHAELGFSGFNGSCSSA
ncbi:fungal-specific transcription factor domain-containing protein [Mycena floridula]|nr:fungal-specific transcription factor domain-containing protein [Mycena floridula]